MATRDLKYLAELSCNTNFDPETPPYTINQEGLFRDFIQLLKQVERNPFNAVFIEEVAQEVFDSIRLVISDDDPPFPYVPRTKIRINNFGVFHRDEHGKLVFECDPDWEKENK